MTNQEQAKAISEKYKDIRYDWDDSPVKEYEKVAFEMAEWKDQQFKEYLEKKKEKYPLSFQTETSTYKKAQYHIIINEIINELFKNN